ncbi:MAG: hypothetical protein WB471_07845, partial [Nocardioides sp.]
FEVILTVVVLLGVVVLILLFERRRAEQIERDTSEMAREARDRHAQDDSHDQVDPEGSLDDEP